MPYPKEFPHSLLKIGRSFTKAELVKAMGQANAMAQANVNKSALIAKNTTAFHELSDIRKRLEYEILLPSENAEMEKELDKLAASLVKTDYLPQTCPGLPLPPVFFNLNDEDLKADFADVPYEVLVLTFSDKYDDVSQAKLPITFDK